ncbi:MAG: DUF488 domain-containing protein [Chlorobi bacterium]|nr:DUF488 domain-containing protein [Chlorobiota bacterium]
MNENTRGKRLFSIGHSNKSIDQFISELKDFGTEVLIDVRSKPYSRRFPYFNKEFLNQHLESAGIKYVYLGDLLGGLPNDPSCYTNGKVDYNKLRKKDYFRKGIELLKEIYSTGIKAAIMCSEGNPAHCHRTLLIGVELSKEGIELEHIVVKGDKTILKPQKEVIKEAFPRGTRSLF